MSVTLLTRLHLWLPSASLSLTCQSYWVFFLIRVKGSSPPLSLIITLNRHFDYTNPRGGGGLCTWIGTCWVWLSMRGMMGTPSVHQKEPLAFLLFFNQQNGLFLSWCEGDLHQVVELFVFSSSKLCYYPNSFLFFLFFSRSELNQCLTPESTVRVMKP